MSERGREERRNRERQRERYSGDRKRYGETEGET